MLMLGFSSGLPFFLTGNTLGYWLRDQGTTLQAIGFLSWVGLAYSLKFLWAPVVDRLDAPVFGWLGRRRSWMLLTQSLIAIGLIGMASTGTSHGLAAIGALAVVVAFSSSTQDIVIDAWRIEAAGDSDELGLLSAAYQLGYRAAIIVTDALILISASHLGWPISYAAMGVLVGIGMTATMLAIEPRRSVAPAGSSPSAARLGSLRGFIQAVVGPFVEFFSVYGPVALLMLAMISLYRLPEYLMGPMANPYYHDLGLSKDAVGAVRASIGLVGSLLGIAAGGLSAVRIGYFRTLIVGLFLQSIVIAMFAILAYTGPDLRVFGAIMAIRQLRRGVRRCRPRHLHVHADHDGLHGDAVRAPELRLHLCREVREGLLGRDGGIASVRSHAARGLRAVLHRRRVARRAGAAVVRHPGARAAATEARRAVDRCARGADRGHRRGVRTRPL